MRHAERQEMRIYAVADIHGKADRIEIIRHHIVKINPDILVIAGDITGHVHDAVTLAVLNDLNIPILVVPGNMDALDFENQVSGFKNMLTIHLKTVIHEGMIFSGWGGTIKSTDAAPWTASDHNIPEAADAFARKTEILVTHVPPWGVLDKGYGGFHGGSKTLAGIIVERQPAVLICGHMHESKGMAYLAETLVVNCSMGCAGAGAFIEIVAGQQPKAMLIE